MNGQVEAGNRAVTINSWEPQRRLFHIEAGPSGVARVRTYFYPHWLATEGGRGLNTSAAADGTLLVNVPERDVDVAVVFSEPERVRVAAIASGVAALAILALAIFGWCRSRSLSGLQAHDAGGSDVTKLFVSPILKWSKLPEA
jgi:hypothetical protein